jgi:hypothetical protein
MFIHEEKYQACKLSRDIEIARLSMYLGNMHLAQPHCME